MNLWELLRGRIARIRAYGAVGIAFAVISVIAILAYSVFHLFSVAWTWLMLVFGNGGYQNDTLVLEPWQAYLYLGAAILWTAVPVVVSEKVTDDLLRTPPEIPGDLTLRDLLRTFGPRYGALAALLAFFPVWNLVAPFCYAVYYFYSNAPS